jgi:hypothetical protein
MVPMPFSPVHKARKFSVVNGTSLPYNPISTRPEYLLSIAMSKYTVDVIVVSGSVVVATPFVVPLLVQSTP